MSTIIYIKAVGIASKVEILRVVSSDKVLSLN
jgi:hypothetical protein